MTPRPVAIHYRRPPDRVRVYDQLLLLDEPEVKVTLQPATPLEHPLRVGDEVVLEPGSPAVWFTFPGAWHDIGRFHRTDGTFTGLYANILTPPEMRESDRGSVEWDTTDLFLDVWLAPGRTARVLDREEFDRARHAGWIDVDTATRALAEVERILTGIERDVWPPRVVEAWTLERALRATA